MVLTARNFFLMLNGRLASSNIHVLVQRSAIALAQLLQMFGGPPCGRKVAALPAFLGPMGDIREGPMKGQL